MSSNNVLKVKVDSTRGVCEIIDAEGNVVATKDAKTYYSMENVKEKRKALDVERSGRIPPEKLTFVDFLVYDILKEYDEEHQGSEYAKKYLETVTDQITYNIPASDEPLKDKIFRKIIGRTIETEATYLKRVRAIKTEKLSKAGLSISYDDVATINTSSALTSEQIKVAIDIAKRQEKYNGIKTGELIEIPIIDDVPELTAEELEKQRAEAEKEALEKKQAEEAKKAEEAEKARKAAEEAEAARKAAEEAEATRKAAEEAEKAKQQEEHTDDEDKGPKGGAGGAEDKAPKAEEPKQEEPKAEKPHQNAPKPKNKKRKIDGIREGREAYRQRLQAGKPKKADRPEGAPAPKRETKSERKARLAREAYEQRKASASKKPVQKPVVDKTKSKEEASPKVKAEPNKRVNIKQVRVQIDDAKVRFTRKLKDVTDSIRNKVYKPHRKGFKIAGVAALASLLLFVGVKTHNHFNDIEVRGVIADTTSLVQMLEGEKEIESRDTIIRPATELSANLEETPSKGSAPSGMAQTEVNSGAQGVQTQGQAGTKTPSGSGVQSSAPVSAETKTEAQVKAEQEEATREYLSSVRVGSTMRIDNGRYFEAPDGTGNYGHFENYQDCDKVLTIIGVTTQDGYRAIRTDEMSVQDIMEKYPGAKLSYHFEAVNRETGHKTTLGWLTENSRQQTMENTRGQVQMEERER